MSEIAYFILGDFPCSIWKHDKFGHLCGYLGVPSSHPWYGQDYDDIDVNVHGGLTYASRERMNRRPNPERLTVPFQEWDTIPRFIDEPSEKAYPHNTGLDVFWVGFDCAHSGDAVPGVPILANEGSYKNEGYVRAELEKLATQAAAAIAEAEEEQA